MPTLGEFLAGTAEGLTRAVGTAGQAVGTASRIQSMLSTAEQLRRERELFPYQLQTTIAQSDVARLQAEEAKRTQELLNKPVYLNEQPAQQPAVTTPPTTPTTSTTPTTALPSQPSLETLTQQAISTATQKQLNKPIDVKQIKASGLVPETTINAIMSDPVLSQIAVQYDETGRPYTTLRNLQLLDKVLSSTSAIESGLTKKVVQSTIQGLNAEKDKLYDELEKLNQNPDKNKEKIQQIQNRISMINKRIEGTIEYGLSTDFKLLAEYLFKWDKLSAEQKRAAEEIQYKLLKLGLDNEVQKVRNDIALLKLTSQQSKLFAGTPKVKTIVRKDGTVINATEAILPDGKPVYIDGYGNQIDPGTIHSIHNTNDITRIQESLGMLRKEQNKKPKEPRIVILEEPSNKTKATKTIDRDLLNSLGYRIVE